MSDPFARPLFENLKWIFILRRSVGQHRDESSKQRASVTLMEREEKLEEELDEELDEEL